MKPRRTWDLKNLPNVKVVDETAAALEGVQAERLVVLAGAGVSINWPSGMPAAAKFLSAFYDECLPKSCDRGLFIPASDPKTSYLSSLNNFNASLRFEVVISVVQQKFDKRLELLDVFRDGRPNHNHRCLNELARRGAIIITTNFDTLCEEAGTGEYRVRVTEQDFESAFAEDGPWVPEFWHLHGILANPRTGEERRETIVASIHDCWNSGELFRLDRAKGHALERALSERDLLVVGYSGSDDFDIAPALEASNSELRLIWVHHTPTEHDMILPDGITPLVIDRLPSLERWYRAPAANSLATMLADGTRRPDRVKLLRHDTARVLEELAGLPQDESQPAEAGGEKGPVDLRRYFEGWRRKFLPDRATRYLLAILLCDAGGLREEGVRLMREFLFEVLPTLEAPSGSPASADAFLEMLLMAVESDVITISMVEAIPGFQELLQQRPGVAAAVHTTQARIHLSEGRVDEAIATFKEALRLCYATPQFRNVEVVEYETANALFHRGHATGDLAEAEALAKKALQSSRAAVNPESVVRSTILLGRIIGRLSEIHLTKALEYYFEARKEAFKTGRERLIADASGDLGYFLWVNGAPSHYTLAANYMAEAYRIYSNQEVWPRLERMATNLALCCEALGDEERSLMAHCMAFGCTRHTGDAETGRQALERIRAGARSVLPGKDLEGMSDEEIVTFVYGELRSMEVSI